jgi:hypothetical protein
VSLASLGSVNSATALQLEDGVVITPNSTDPMEDTYSFGLYLTYGSTIHVQPVIISGNGWTLYTTPVGDPFDVSCDVTNTYETLNFVAQTSLLKP